MALFGRLARQSVRLLAKPRLHFDRTVKPTACFISTSKKNKDAMVVEKTISKPETEENLEAKEEVVFRLVVFSVNLFCKFT